MAPKSAQNKSTQRRKKAAVLGVAGIVGLGAAATMANWTDEEFAGADLNAGKFHLQIATTAHGDLPVDDDWEDGTTVDAFEHLEIKDGPWGPGESEQSDIHIRLHPDTTHDAELTSTRTVDDAENWKVEGPDSEEVTLSRGVGNYVTFPVTVAMHENSSNDAQGKTGEVVWEFDAKQQPNSPASGGAED